MNITNPVDGSRFEEGQPVPLRATALDAEDGLLEGESVVWSSDKDGAIAIGTAANPVNLSVGEHTITATATDSDFATADAQISIGIDARPPQPPVASITQPLTDETFAQGVEILLVGAGDDPDGPDPEESAFVRASDIDGQIGIGRQVASDALSLGDHLVTLTVKDPQGLSATASVAIEISP